MAKKKPARAKTKKGRRRWQLWMSDEDFAAAGVVREKHGHADTASAIRFAIREQSRRDSEEKNGE